MNPPTTRELGAVRAGQTPLPRRARTAPGTLPSWWAWLGPWGGVKVVVFAGLYGWLYHEELYRLFLYWQSPDWSHGFLIAPMCLYFVHVRKANLMQDQSQGSWWGGVGMGLCFWVYTRAIVMKIGYPQQLSMVGMLAGMVLLLRGWRTLWYCAFPIGFLLLAIPPPERLYREVTQPLQQIAAAVSTVVLNAFPGAEVERGGVNIAYYMRGGEEGMFTVAGACSGMRSLMAFIALGLGMAYFTRGPLWHRLVMAVLVVPVAIFCNVLRVIITGLFQMYKYGDLASGTPHTVLGLVMFGLGFLLYFAAMYVLDHLFVEGPSAAAPSDASGGAA